jgi:hypothetical protein
MRRYPVEVNATATWFQVGGLLLVAAAVFSILAVDVDRHDRSATARAPVEVTQQAVLPDAARW